MSRFVEVLRSEIVDLERQLEANTTYMKLREARRLLAVYASVDSPPSSTPMLSGIAEKPNTTGAVRARQFSGNSAAALEAAKQYIKSVGRPAKTTEVLEAIGKVGVTFGGNVPQNTLSSIMSKSPDFISVRGVGWVLTAETSKELADGATPTKETPSAMPERQDDFLTEPQAQGREAGPGGSA